MIDIVKNNEINITEDEWTELKITHSQEAIKQLISDAIKDNNLELPYRKITLEEAKEDFIELCKLDTSNFLVKGEFNSRYDYKYKFSDEYITGCNVGNKCSDYFQQKNRFTCDSINAPSPDRTWHNEKFRMTLLNGLFSLKYKEINNNTLRTCISLRKYIASQFKPSVAKTVYDMFKAKTVLDFSAGWGDRLAGFCASEYGELYIGIDPNINVFNKYIDQIDEYSRAKDISHKKTKLFNLPAEDVVLDKNDKLDLIFSSSPYFDVERYTNEDNQSWKRYKHLDDWLNKFLFKMLDNFWDSLNVGGHMVINLSDVYCHHTIQKMCDPMNDFINKLDGSDYRGCIGMRMAKRPNSKAAKAGVNCEPMWIWQKT